MLSREMIIEQDVGLNQISFSIYNKIDTHSVAENNSFGRHSYCEPYAMIQSTIIHSFVDITRGVRIGAAQHPLQRPTTHHIACWRRMYGVRDTDDEAFFEQYRSRLIEIGRDIWVGHNALIEASVKAGDGAVIGSGAIATHDVLSYAIVAEAPAKTLRFRLDCEQIAAFLDVV